MPSPTPGWGSPAVLAAVIAGAVALISLAVNAIVAGSRQHVDRRRDVFSKAFAVVVSYAEYPYVLRRRRASDPEGERIRISEELRKIQADLAYYTSWIATESRQVGEAYTKLVGETRRIAGQQIHDAWLQPPLEEDASMNMPDLGLNELLPYRDQFLSAVRSALGWRGRLRRA